MRESIVFLYLCLGYFIARWPPVPSILLQWGDVILFMHGCHSVVHIFSLTIHPSVAIPILYLGYCEQCCRVHGAAGVSAICWWHVLRPSAWSGTAGSWDWASQVFMGPPYCSPQWWYLQSPQVRFPTSLDLLVRAASLLSLYSLSWNLLGT